MSIGNEQRHFGWRVLHCISASVSVYVVSYLCAWYEYRGFFGYRYEQYETRRILENLRQEIERTREDGAELPQKLQDLEVVQAERLLVDPAGRVLDGWGRPIFYHIQADRYELYSNGRDGKPGGYGLDADLRGGEPASATELPTLWQFTNDLSTTGIKLTCFLAGMIAFTLCFIYSIRLLPTQSSLAKTLTANTVTAVFCVLTAVVMSFLHLPSGH